MLVSLSVTGVIGFFELVTAIFVSTIDLHALDLWLHQVLAQELLQSPHSILLILVVRSLPTTVMSATLRSITLIWLIVHGVTNLALSFAVLTNRFWIYPLAISSFTLLTLYQFYLFLVHPRPVLAIFVLVGGIVVWLTWLDYRAKQTMLALPPR